MKVSILALTFATMTSFTIIGCSSHSVDQAHTTSNAVTLPSTRDSHDNHANSHDTKWSYDTETGPDVWGDMEGFEACKLGHEQSPVDITSAVLSDKQAPQFNYTNSNLNVIDNYHTVMFSPTATDNTIYINDDAYTLKQFHYHAPSEHMISGVNYPAELHFVHANSQGELAVVGVMLYPSINDAHPTLTQLIDVAKLTNNNHEEAYTKNIDITSLLPDTTNYFHYSGSLTTPPCSEKVQWYIAQQPVAVSLDQITQLVQMHKAHSRPIQPIGERVIEYIK